MSLSKAIRVISGINEFGNLFQLVRSAVSYMCSQLSGSEEKQLKEDDVLQLQSDLQCLRETLPTMYNLIDRAEWRSHVPSVEQLLPNLKDAVYDADDLLDEFRWYEQKVEIEGNATQLSPFIEFFHSVTQGSFNKVVDIQNRLRNLSSQLEKMGLHAEIPRFDKSLRPVTTSFRTELKIFGRERELEEVIILLGVPSYSRGSSSSKRKRSSNVINNEPSVAFVPVLPIVGIGGVGKTTLAREITTLERVKSYFDKIIWICVSDEFDEERFTKVLIKSLSGKEATTDNLDDLQQILAREVRKKRFLLILDDIWPNALNDDGRCWRKFCGPLTNVHQGSVLIVTTRFAEVANIVGTMNPFALQGLKDDVFWDFFKLCVFGSEDYYIDPQLEQIGRSIIPKLKGAPLAAKTIGRLLRKSLDPAHWNDILNSELWQLRQQESDILPALRLSYMYLPFNLKRCFSFCATYPKDYNFDKSSLVEIWVAEGFVEPQGSIPLQHIGGQYFDDLVNLSFFQKLRGKYVIHDLMHDMAQLVSKEDCFIVKNASDIEMVPQNVRHLSILRSCDVKLSNLLSLCKHKKLRTLLCNKSLGSEILYPVMDYWFGGLRYLRVVFCASTKGLPESIGNLKHLRYLEISRRCHFNSFPSSFCSLYNLQIFSARKCTFGRLPRHISKLVNLHKFDTTIAKTEVNAEDWEEKIRFINNLNLLTSDLTIYNLGAISKDRAAEAELKKKEYLNSLTLTWYSLRCLEHNEIEVLQALQPPANIKSVHIEGYPGEYLPSWFRGYDRPEDMSFSELPPAATVDNNNGGAGAIFSLLTEVIITRCQNLSSLEQFLHPTTYVPAIRKIVIANCPSLKSVPIEWSPSLEEISVSKCPKMTHLSSPTAKKLVLMSYIFGSTIDCSSLTFLDIHSPQLPFIELEKWSLPVLQRLHIKFCLCLKFIRESDVSLGWARARRSTAKFPLLTHLTIECCSKLESIDDLLTHECLPAIESIIIQHCDLLSLPTERFENFPFMKNLEIGWCPRLYWQSGMVLPPSLQTLILCDCGDFSAWSPRWCLQNLTSLESLSMESCQGIVSIPGDLWRSNLKSLQNLKIQNCPDLLSIGGPEAITHINRVYIGGCPKLMEIEQPSGNLCKSDSGPTAREGGDVKRRGELEPPGYLQVGVDSSLLRRLFQLLVHVRTTISSSSGALPSDAWFNDVINLSSDAEKSLEDLHYKMILAMLRFGRHQKKMFNVSGTCSKTASISFTQLPSPEELAILSITDKLESLEHGSPGLSGAVLANYSDTVSLSSLVMRCILLCRGILGIMSIVGAEGMEETLELPVFAFDDLTYAGQKNKVTRMSKQSIPASVIDPIYLLPIFIRSLQYLDLSGCSSLTQMPPSIGNLHNLAALNLSRCYSLCSLPVPLGKLQNLQILVLSLCHALRSLPVSLCELSKLRFLDLSGCSSLENLPDSLVNLGHLENLNLSNCKELKELPQPFANLQELKYLNLSGSHGVDLDAEYLCALANLKCLTLSPLTNIHGFPDSFRELANCLDRLRWWKKNRVHPQCNLEAASLYSYRRYEQNIIDMLLYDQGNISSDQIVTSICIVGESGMGKTELVCQIYNNQMVLDTFDLRIWVYVCDKKRLLGKIVESTTCAYCSDAPISVLEEVVIEELTGKRLLLVLDNSDSKSQYFWSYVPRLLNVCANGSALIVTTKSMEVANLVGAMQTCYLSSLSKEECFMIFKGHVLGGLDMNNYPQLESIGWKLVEKCGGNPMCVKALSGLLCHSEIGLAEVDMLVDGTLPALRLCYDLLPSHLQQCFRFCSLFPKDHIFIKHHIIRLWISQGFVLPEEGNQPEDTGLHYFDELVCRSFFQRCPFHIDQDDEYVMHELFHDLATSVSKNECFRSEEPFCSLAENICHLSLVLSDFKTVALAKEARNLQSFLVVRKSFPVVRILNSDDLYMKFGSLRALNLSYTDILELPGSIGNMKHLRLLALNNTKIKGLPFEIGQVGTLQTLELKDCCHLTDLPESTSNLAKLRHLDVQKEPGNIKVGMPHGIGQLTDLQTLTEFNIGNNLSQCSIAEFKNLNGLRGHVHVTGLENIKTADDAREANIVGKHFLEAMTLEWCYNDEDIDDGLCQEIANNILQNLQPNSNLQKLVVQNYPGNLFPLWMQDSYLRKLVSVTLDNCYGCSKLPYLGDLPSLKSLFIQRMNSIESFEIGSSSLSTEEKRPPRFPSLEALTLWEMYDLQFWVGTSEWDFPRICRLSISRCPRLRNLPPLCSLKHLSVHFSSQVPSFSELPSLESLKIEGFNKIRSISFPHQLTMLKKLEINDCKELSSMYAYSLSVSELRVVRCPKLDLVGSSLEDHHKKKEDGERNSSTRRSMVLKTATYTDLQVDSWKWEKHGEKSIFGSNLARSYYRCLHRNSTGCCATKILESNDTDPNMLSAMYIYEHNHKFPNDPHLELSAAEPAPTRKRKEPDVPSDEHSSKRTEFLRRSIM